MKARLKYVSAIVIGILFTLSSCIKEEETVYPDLKVSVSEMSLTEGDTQKATITSGSDFYTVSSSDPSKVKAVLNKNIVTVTAIAEGNSKIVITDSKTKQTQTINVIVKAAIPDLAISKNEFTFEAGQTATTTITAGSGDYTVNSSDDSRATAKVENSIITITGVAEGTVKLTVKDNKTEQSKEITITVNPKTPDLAISKTELIIEVEQTVTATITAGSGDYTVSSSDDSKATAKLENGVITITGVAEATVKLTIKDNKTEQTQDITVIVESKTPNLAINKNELVVEAGQTSTATITAGSGNYTVSGSDDSKATAKVENGIITITGIAEATVKLTIKDNKTEQIQDITVIVEPKTPDLAISKNELTVEAGQTSTITIATGSGNYKVSSSDESKVKAIVSEGVIHITGVSEGESLISIIDNKSNQTKEIKINIQKATPNLQIDTSEIKIEEGKTATIKITQGSGNYKVISSDNKIATVKLENGTITITGVAEGTTILTVTDNKNGQTKEIQVAIVTKIVDLSIEKTELSIEINTIRIVAITSGNGEYTINSEDESIAKAKIVNEKISIQGLKIGSTVITVADIKSNQEKKITVKIIEQVSEFSLSHRNINMFVNAKPSFVISSGSGYFNVESKDTSIVRVSKFSDNVYHLIGESEGSTYIEVSDKAKPTVIKKIMVTVRYDDLSLSKYEVGLLEGAEVKVNITGGNGTYNVVSKNSSVAKATLTQGKIVIKGESRGATKVMVTDIITNQKIEIVVIVNPSTTPPSSPSLSLSIEDVSVNVSENTSVNITSGSGNYSVSSGDSTKATATLSGSTITINGVAAGTTIITVTDTDTSQTKQITVTVNAPTAPNLSLSIEDVSVNVSENTLVSITSGSGNYSVSSSDPTKATVTLSGNTITINGVAAGTATITVTDTDSNQTKEVSVTINDTSSNLTLSSLFVTIAQGANATIDITSGTGSYTVASNNTNAIAEIIGNTVSITGVSNGVVILTVTDSGSSQTKQIIVSVTPAVSGLTLSRSSASVEVGGTTVVGITSGSGSYTVNSSDSTKATATLSGSTITINGVAVGTAIITVTDTGDGQTKQIAVTVNAAATPLELSTYNTSIDVGSNATVTITSGTGSAYIVTSNDPSIATVTSSLSGNIITINGIAVGTTTINVIDTGSNQTKQIAVTVNASTSTQSYIEFTTAKNIDETIYFTINAATADRPNVWIDLNNNGIKDANESIIFPIGSAPISRNFTIASQTMRIYGKVTMMNFNYFVFRPAMNATTVSAGATTTTLDPNGQMLTALDVSNNTYLENLYCAHNGLNSLDLSNNAQLTTMNCGYNSLTCIKVSSAQLANIPSNWTKDNSATYNTSCP